MPDTHAIRAFLDADHLDVARRADEVCTRMIAPLSAPEDDAAARARARELLVLMGREGLYAPIANRVARAGGPEEHDEADAHEAPHEARLAPGLAQDLRACALTRETLAAASPLADAVWALQALGTTPLLLADNHEVRERWAPAALKGEAMAAFAMTEPDAGSDVAAIATTARRDGDAYVLDGTKTFISNAGIADFYTVFASTDPDAGHRGLSCFVVPATTPGLRFVRPLVLSEPHPLGEIAFEDCRIPAAWRLGQEGDGFKLGMATLDRLRPTVGAAACGIAARALAEALAHATTRRQFGSPLAEFQLIQQKLARMATELDAARLLVYRAAWEKDRGAERITLEAAMAKAYATEAAQRIVDDAVQILGGRGVVTDHPVDRLYRAVRALRIYEGATEVQQLVIARHVIGRASSPVPATGRARASASAATGAGAGSSTEDSATPVPPDNS